MTRPRRAPLAPLVYVAGVMGSLPPMLTPLVLEAVVSGFGIPNGRATTLLSAQLAGLCIANGLLSVVVDRLDRRALLAVSLALFGVSALAVAARPPEGLGLALLFAMGLGEGGLLAGAYASHAASPRPERAFAVQFAITTAAMIGVFPVVAAARAGYGWQAVFIALAGSLVVLPGLAWGRPAPAGAASAGPSTAPSLGRSAAVLSLATLIVFINFSLWTFTERMGAGLGVAPEAIGRVLGLAAFVGLGSGLAAAWLGVRRGRALPLLMGIAVLAASSCLMLGATALEFTIGLVLFYAAWLFEMPYLLGLVASVDPAGRLVALTTASQNAAMALAPVAAGSLVARGGTGNLLVPALALYGLAAVLAVVMVGSTTRSAAATLPAS